MANYKVRDAFGSIITIQSSTFGTEERQIVGVSVMGAVPTTFSGSPSISGAVTVVGNPSVSGTVGASIIGLTPVAVTNIPSISGTVNVGNLPTTQNVSGSVLAFQGGVNISSVIGAIAVTATTTSVKGVASTTVLLASNSGRRGATIGNYSATSVMVKLGAMANSGDFTLLMQDTDYYEVPFNYSGVIDHFSSSTAGLIRVTEIT